MGQKLSNSRLRTNAQALCSKQRGQLLTVHCYVLFALRKCNCSLLMCVQERYNKYIFLKKERAKDISLSIGQK